MGGGDSANITATVLEALVQSKHSDIAIDVVVGGANPHIHDIQARCAKLPHACLYRQVDNMAKLMCEADLAIGATGVSTWERAALGLPALAVSVAGNQREIGRYADEAGLLHWLGDADNISLQEWSRGIDVACDSAATLRCQRQACVDLVDANGAQRVAEAML
jgi:UDP-2,4-diacetamido-2,4,6-trideoxy-beta-L-altropyranose hydrolase